MNPAQTNQPGLHRLSPGIVPIIADNIPVHPPEAATSPDNDDEELDKIMRDVGNQLKADDNQPAKKRISFTVRSKRKADVKFSAQPITPPPAPKPVATVAPHPINKKVADKARSKTATEAPFFVIFVASVVTVVLFAAAIAAYKK